MDPKLLDKTIVEDYNKFEPNVKQDIIKKRPKIKEIILEVSFTGYNVLEPSTVEFGNKTFSKL